MKLFNSIISYIRATANYRWKRIVLNLPFRMVMGRFGILLMKLGRALQVRYANWNSEFRLEHEIAICLPGLCWVNVSERVTDKPELTFISRSSQPHNMTQMVSALFDIKGVSSVLLQPYRVSIGKGDVFSWEEILPFVDEVILEHLTAA